MSNIYIGCTAKLLTTLKTKKESSPDIQSISEINKWHANLNYLDRRKMILFTHDLSYFSFPIIGVKKSEFDILEKVFIDSAANNLFRQGFTEQEIELLLPLKSEIIFGKSHNRSVIGTMNNFGRYIPYMYERSGMFCDGIPTLNQFGISKELNDVPVQCGKKGFFPERRLKELVDDMLSET